MLYKVLSCVLHHLYRPYWECWKTLVFHCSVQLQYCVVAESGVKLDSVKFMYVFIYGYRVHMNSYMNSYMSLRSTNSYAMRFYVNSHICSNEFLHEFPYEFYVGKFNIMIS